MDKDTLLAIKNEYRDMINMLGHRVKVERLPVAHGEGLLCKWKFNVNAPSYYISSKDDVDPKRTHNMVFYMELPNGFPKTAPKVYYPTDKMLASINVYRSGTQCIDTWYYDDTHSGGNSSVKGVVKKTLLDIIHEPSVSNFNSQANSSLCSWQRTMNEKGLLPTCKASDGIIKTERELMENNKKEKGVTPMPRSAAKHIVSMPGTRR